MEGNRDAINVWNECRTQVIAGFGGVIDINMLAVKQEMDMRGIKNQMVCKGKVRILNDEYMTIKHEAEESAKSKD
jgi:hypothetical protein